MPPEPPLPSAFEAIEAPWTLKGEAWWFALSLVGGAGRAQPPGSFDPLERYSAELGEDAQSFSGGLGVAMLIRYHDSPVGAPLQSRRRSVKRLTAVGRTVRRAVVGPGPVRPASIPSEGGVGQDDLPRHEDLRVVDSVCGQRCAVSVAFAPCLIALPRSTELEHPQGAEVSFIAGVDADVGGQHLAKFDFRTLSDGQTEVRVYPISPSSSEVSPNPCFAARLTESRFFPSLPLNTSRLPMGFDLVQPPLEASPSSDKDGVVGTKKWKLVPGVSFKGRITLGGVQGLLDGDGPKGGARIGDGSGFPDIKPYSVAMHWTSVEVGFPAPQILP